MTEGERSLQGHLMGKQCREKDEEEKVNQWMNVRWGDDIWKIK